MVKRPRPSEASDGASPSRFNGKWSFRRLNRVPSLSLRKRSASQGAQSPTFEHCEQSVGRTLQLESSSDGHNEWSTKQCISEDTPTPPQHRRTTSSVARELMHGLHSFVNGRRQRSKVDPYVDGIDVDNLALSSGDAFQLAVWTPGQEYESTLRIRDEYGKMMATQEAQEMQMDTPSSETSYGSGSSQHSTSMALDSADYSSDSAKGASTSTLTLEDFEMLDTLGTGTFGRVLLVRRKGANPDDRSSYFAMKVMSKSAIVRLRQVEHISSERAILSMIDHPFIVNLHCTFQDSLNVYMLMDFIVGGEIFTHLRRAKYFTTDVTRFYIASLVLAIKELHSRKIVYRDLKPENLLIDSEGYVKITDFGFAKQLVETDRTWTLCGTPEYLSPEVILSRSQSFASDYWCLGILMYEMLVGHPPFYDSTPFATYEKIVAANVHFPPHIDATARDLITSLLTVDVSRRLGNLRGGAKDVMDHPWFYGINWQALLDRRVPVPFIPSQKHPSDSSNFDKYGHYDISNMPAMHVGIQADRSALESDPWKHLFTAF